LLFPISAKHPLIDYRFRHWKPADHADGHAANGTPFRTWRLPHPGGSTGFRLSLPNGKDLAFVTDTRAEYVPLSFVEGVDTLVHECNFTDDLAVIARNSGHSTTSQVFDLARRAGVRRLVCIHWNSLLEIEAGHQIADMTGRDPGEKLPFELVLSDDRTVIDL
jgi:ribonuclease BN (tRNA processing enzyme)